jgi:hypothetical protein
VDWIIFAQDRDRWLRFVDITMRCSYSEKGADFLDHLRDCYIFKHFTFWSSLTTVKPGYSDIGLYETLPIASNVLWYQLIPHC